MTEIHPIIDTDVLSRIRRSATIALILSPTGLLTIAIGRLLIVSDYNQTTAMAIVSSGGYTNVLIGSIIPVFPLLLPYLGVLLLFFRKSSLGILTLAASALVSPTSLNWNNDNETWRQATQWVNQYTIWTVAIFSGISILSVGMGAFTRTIGTIASIALVPYLMAIYPLPYKDNSYATELRRPWLPSETISLASNQKVVGYTLSSSSDWLVVLDEKTRHVEYYPSREVVRRSICQLDESQTGKPLLSLRHSVTALPRCAGLR